MNCDFCGNPAKVFFTQLVDGQMKKICMCEPCAEERGVTNPTGFSLTDLLHGGVAVSAETAPQAPRVQASGKACPNCGFTLEELHKVRRFGCSECYGAFADEVAQIVRGMHKGSSHIGKVPEGLVAMQVLRQRMDELQTRLGQAVTSEQYEEAAGLRDEIRKLAEKTSSGKLES